jgi:hypothetical protein
VKLTSGPDVSNEGAPKNFRRNAKEVLQKPFGRKAELDPGQLLHSQERRGPPLAQTESRFHFHLALTSSSWLNQIERFFALITDRMIRRGTFHSAAELEQAVYRWLAPWNSS